MGNPCEFVGAGDLDAECKRVKPLGTQYRNWCFCKGFGAAAAGVRDDH